MLMLKEDTLTFARINVSDGSKEEKIEELIGWYKKFTTKSLLSEKIVAFATKEKMTSAKPSLIIIDDDSRVPLEIKYGNIIFARYENKKIKDLTDEQIDIVQMMLEEVYEYQVKNRKKQVRILKYEYIW